MTKNRKLYGLVLAGGQSKRMKQDKSVIEYHGLSQVRYCYELLSKFCAQVYVSNRKEQSTLEGHRDLPQIHDQYDNIGPLGGILTAMQAHPDAAWLVLACDLPFVTTDTLRHLVNARDKFKMATAYASSGNPELPEPLCAIYEPSFTTGLLEFYRQGLICPRKILSKSETKLIRQRDKSSLDNVNSAEECNQAKHMISRKEAGR